MKTFFRRFLVVIIGLVCLTAPFYLRSSILNYNQRTYTPPKIDGFNIAATPAPTMTPAAFQQTSSQAAQALRRGPIVVDLAHFNRLNPSNFQPLQSALAEQGIGLRFWLSKADVSKLTSYLDFPDQSEALATQLNDASGLIVISPFFLWSKQEIALLEKFVANGGRLLLISDPDVQGDSAVVTNMVAEPFGIVFNDDYLYDTVANDENYTHFFQKTFAGQASSLDGSKIAFYGGRSINGAVESQVRSAPTTLSSLLNGLSGFTTVAIGGQAANQSKGRVLAMSDFDVLAEPYVNRFDNRRILTFVAHFLGGSQREETVANFPTYLGKEVSLVVDSADGVNAELLSDGADLQQRLGQTGRTLTLAGTALLTSTKVLSTSVTTQTATDVIYLADFEGADQHTTLLNDIGIKLVKEVTIPTPTATPLATPTNPPTKTAPARMNPTTATASTRALPTLTATATITTPELPTGTITPQPELPNGTVTPTVTIAAPRNAVESVATVTVTTPATVTAQATITSSAGLTTTPTVTVVTALTTPPAPTPTPQITYYLQTNDGLRLQANQTLLIVQRQSAAQQKMVAVLGFDSNSVELGITRLLNNDLKDCMSRRDLAICPVAPDKNAGKDKERSTAQATPTPKAGTKPGSTPSPEPTGSKATSAILLVDDNAEAKSNEKSEADFYLQTLTKAGRDVKLWTTAKDGAPSSNDMGKYKWVIWSDAAYASSGLGTDKLQSLSDYLSKGGRLLISSRLPFFGVGGKAASVIADVVVSDTSAAALVQNLPKEPIALTPNLPAVVPLEINDEPNAPSVILRRGPKSADADAPVMLLMTDTGTANSVGARLIVLDVSITWLPEAVSGQLVNNMTEYMLKDK
ncbi:MAG: DUF4350 domain-containing protein [Caldilineaceae bacterium]